MDVTLPDLGESIREAEVLKVLVREGDAVAADQPLLELETDKAAFELPSPQAGTVSRVHVKKGDTIRVGQKVLTIEAGRKAGDGREAKKKTKDDAPARAEAREAESDDAVGEPAERAPARPRTHPAPVSEQRAADEGPERGGDARGAPGPRRPEKGRVPVPAKEEEGGAGEDAGEPEDRPEGRAVKAAKPEGRTEPRPKETAAPDVEVAAGPAARRLARELEVDLARIRGTGSGGRITPEDVQAFVRDRAPAARPVARSGAPAAEDERCGPVERRALTGIEKAAARHLSASWNEIPHVTHHDLADVTELEDARRRYEAEKDEAEPKLTWTALVVKAVVVGLRAFPRVNSSLDLEREELVTKLYVHVGVAVDTEHGLLVPVLRDPDRKTTREITAEIAQLAERARARKLAPQDMQGASFTVTNVGGIGGIAFTPIVSRPEVAILGVARTREELTLRAGQVAQRIVLPLSLSYDHRVINGADAARFVRYVAELLEDPLHLLLES
jgi:pyruvate dehydrogenase E2 component (dihydrolipoyllysine-residue acetyltransferase)